MAIFDPSTSEFYCECKCGEIISPWNSFKAGHNMKTEEAKKRVGENTSRCLFGRVLSWEVCERMSEAEFKSYEENPTRRDSLLGHVTSVETIEKLKRASNSFWASDEGWKLRMRYRGCFGENHPNWKGGYDGRYGLYWSAVRDFILIRDNYTCQGCGSEVDLCVHHIDEDLDNVDEHNLITVCKGCNNRAASKSQKGYWFEFYTNRIVEKYTSLDQLPIATGLTDKQVRVAVSFLTEKGVVSGIGISSSKEVLS